DRADAREGIRRYGARSPGLFSTVGTARLARTRRCRRDDPMHGKEKQARGCPSGLLPCVDLFDLYYKNSSTPVTAADLRAIRRAAGAFAASNPLEVRSATARNTLQDKEEIRTPKRKWTRLHASAKADIVARYEAGETSTALAAEYGVAKSTV